MIDAEDRVFGKRAVQRLVQRSRRLEVAPERLLDDDARAVGAAGAQQVLDRRRKRARWNREIEDRPASVAERPPDVREELEGTVIAGHVLQQRRETREGGLVDGAARRHALPHAIDQLLARHRQPADSDDRHVQLLADDERLQRGEDFLVGEIAGEAKDDDRVGMLGR